MDNGMHPEKTIIVAFLIRIYIDENIFKKGYIYICTAVFIAGKIIAQLGI